MKIGRLAESCWMNDGDTGMNNLADCFDQI